MVEISEDLKEIVSTTIESIKEGMKGKGCGLGGPIEFEIADLLIFTHIFGLSHDKPATRQRYE